ncbi:5-oxoprolinase subunit PxpA [Salimicrobium flavidum]|uniref:5-oxoprolinase subunit A n=1 Tax=Salimicrobium flavidum TaxID=570947 RepID=A0A1N7JJG7_9BACI|nr:5-oxoprolinase subunit PxpA [Salimicrobium flavidum]SIS49394.1 UPF0271 protein [Salimicrobium flavidum]
MGNIDLNCDLGEGFEAHEKKRDEDVLQYVTSANIACGFHAGDAGTMQTTVRLAKERNVAIGAHPGLPDFEGFGRREMHITPERAYALTIYQTGALQAFAEAAGTRIRHVKPHGALYTMAAKDPELARAIAEAVWDVKGDMLLYGLAGSELIKAGEKVGLNVVSEVFADRVYQADGTLKSRQEHGAVITDRAQAMEQVRDMVLHKKVKTIAGTYIDIEADSICVHGDNEEAVHFARSIREFLMRENIALKSP